jgi:hypothetical protein
MVFEFPCDVVELLSKLLVLVYSIRGDLVYALCLLFGQHTAALILQLGMVVIVSSFLGKGCIALRLLFDEILSDAILLFLISDFIPILTKYFSLVADEVFFVLGITSFKSKLSHQFILLSPIKSVVSFRCVASILTLAPCGEHACSSCSHFEKWLL